MVCRRVGGIRECLLPRVDVSGTLELYPSEKVFSGARNPRLGDETALLEYFRFFAQEVDDAIGDFWWETRTWHAMVGLRVQNIRFDRKSAKVGDSE